MKYIIILGDGMADEPLEAFGGKTPSEGGFCAPWILTCGFSGIGLFWDFDL